MGRADQLAGRRGGVLPHHRPPARRTGLPRPAGVPMPVRNQTRVPAHLAALGITDRECEVLTLVIDGMTSREIAARLYLSVRTVDKHVERLLAKTGVARRVQLRRLRT